MDRFRAKLHPRSDHGWEKLLEAGSLAEGNKGWLRSEAIQEYLMDEGLPMELISTFGAFI